ncbi:MAG: hypothetical protein GXP25_10735 [Planctomycetes bacterium]|nr:hypothetical protein [Planctomycetota bacterium]
MSLSDTNLSDFLEDRKNAWTPADQTTFKVDWTEFLSERGRVDEQVAGMLAKGYLKSEAVRLSRPAVTYRMDRMREDWETYCGDVTL